jgi:hypothetical protein
VLALVLDLADAFGEGTKAANWRQQRRIPSPADIASSDLDADANATKTVADRLMKGFH